MITESKMIGGIIYSFTSLSSSITYLDRINPVHANIEDTIRNEASDVVSQEVKVKANHTAKINRCKCFF